MNGLKSELADENAKVAEIEADLVTLQQGLVKAHAHVAEALKEHETKSTELEDMKRKFAFADSKIAEAQMRKDENDRMINVTLPLPLWKPLSLTIPFLAPCPCPCPCPFPFPFP